jgi:hypothetical protein
MPVDQRSVGEWPEVFSGLQLGRIRRQEEEVVGNPQALCPVPASAIQHEHDLPGRARADCSRIGGEFGLEEGNIHRRGEVKDRAT